MKLKARFEIPQFNLLKYQQQLHKEIVDLVLFGAFEWLDAATAVIPIWSGASRATFLAAAREVGFNHQVGQPNPAAPDRIPLGINNSDGKFQSSVPGVATFTYETSLRHLIFNEFNNANLGGDPAVFSRLIDPGPYGFQALGQAAFLRVTGGYRLPDPTTFIKIKVKRVR